MIASVFYWILAFIGAAFVACLACSIVADCGERYRQHRRRLAAREEAREKQEEARLHEQRRAAAIEECLLGLGDVLDEYRAES